MIQFSNSLRLNSRRASSPLFFVRPGASRFSLVSCLPLPPEGRAERRAFHRARGATCCRNAIEAHGALRREAQGKPLLF